MEFIPRVQKSILKSPSIGVKGTPIIVSKCSAIDDKVSNLEARLQNLDDLFTKISSLEARVETLENFINRPPISEPVTPEELELDAPITEPAEGEPEANNTTEVPLEKMDRAELLVIASELGIRPNAKTNKLIAEIRKARQILM